MATSIVKTTGKTLKKSAQVKAASKAAKGAGKTVKKSAQVKAVTKAARTAASKVGENTRTGTYLAIGATTATGAYLFGPGDSHGRRARLAGVFRRGKSSDAFNDPALKDKVESIIFRPDGSPKGSVSVSVENGVVILRGTVRDESESKSLEKAAKGVSGVKSVDNLLHAPGEPAPAKSESRG
jgi:osmotically-inducible protein OsmY